MMATCVARLSHTALHHPGSPYLRPPGAELLTIVSSLRGSALPEAA